MALMSQVQIFVLACFSQTTNQRYFGNSERTTVNDAVISISLAVQY